jgi:hypothetical protein
MRDVRRFAIVGRCNAIEQSSADRSPLSKDVFVSYASRLVFISRPIRAA